MPAMLDDPDSPTIYRTSGSAPFPDPHDANPALPVDVLPRQVTLRDRVTVATIVPFSSRHQVPPTLLAYLSDQLNKEIENGDTYPMIDGMSSDKFAKYWFQNFGAVMLLGNISSASEVVEGKDWMTECLGSFYIKPNYPGRSSHVCNAGFLVTAAARNRGVGRLMGEAYLDYGPKLGYTYSVFNLVYETNVASCRIWDALGFKRIGKVKGCGDLKSYPGQLIDAIIYGRELGKDVAEEEFVSEERFDKIKFYLKTGKYPAGADRAEKSRLRSAATHYKLVPATPPPHQSHQQENRRGDLFSGIGGEGEEKLMLKDKEVISDPKRQYEIARQTHERGGHGGINKTTATIAERFHWVRIKETVSLVIRNCGECKELGKPTTSTSTVISTPIAPGRSPMSFHHQQQLQQSHQPYQDQHHSNIHVHGHQHHHGEDSYPHQGQQSVSPQVLNRTLPHSHHTHPSHHQHLHQQPTNAPIAQMHHQHPSHHSHEAVEGVSSHQQLRDRLRDSYMPLDPQIMEDVHAHLPSHLGALTPYAHTHTHSQLSSQGQDELRYGVQHENEGREFEAMLGGDGGDVGRRRSEEGDGDLDMLRMSDQEDEDEVGEEVVDVNKKEKEKEKEGRSGGVGGG